MGNRSKARLRLQVMVELNYYQYLGYLFDESIYTTLKVFRAIFCRLHHKAEAHHSVKVLRFTVYNVSQLLFCSANRQ
jgi:hypothetical protein